MLAVLALPVLGVLSIATLARWAPLRQIPLFLTVPLVIAIWIPLSIVALVPADLVDDSDSFGNHGRLIMWRIIYWLSFLLSWLIIPMLQSYVESGYYEPWAKVKDALRANLKYQIMMLGAGTAGLVYMWLSSGMSFGNLKALAVALSYSYSLVIAIWLLGHGMVNVPRDQWNDDVSMKLSYLYTRAVYVHDTYADAQANYDDAVSKVMALAAIKNSRFADWLDDLVESIRNQNLPLSRASSARAQPRDLNDSNLANVSRRLYREQHRAIRYLADWQRLVDDVSFYEDLDKARLQGHLEFRRFEPRWMNPRTQYVYYVIMRPWIKRVIALITAVASLVILWSELVSGTSLSLVDISVSHASGAAQFLLAACFLSYMCLATLSALTSLRIFNIYALVQRDTDPSSLLFYASYMCKLAVPLSYNFLMLNKTSNTAFQEFLGKFINLTPLGKYFNQVLPRLIMIPMALTAFHVYDKAKDYLGFGIYGLEDSEESGLFSGTEEGRELVNRALSGGSSRNGSRIPNVDLSESQPNQTILGKISTWFRSNS